MNNIKNTRMCIICRDRKPKTSLLRIVLDKSNKIVIDEDRKQNTRGLYICPKKECIEKLLKRKNIESMFKASFKNKEINKEQIDNFVEKLKKGVN